ncbi:hypothetical protein [Streptomyces sp. NPDC101115]|uniref:hypothetical protein n=1 Tax=Streptomyces sp. NPDC101115 TaxID=3366106 RepID=UPI0038281CF5
MAQPDMPVRKSADLNAEPLGVIRAGREVRIDCYRQGDQMLWGWGGSSPLWDHVTVTTEDGRTVTGYIADVWVKTGRDINQQTDPCKP